MSCVPQRCERIASRLALAAIAGVAVIGVLLGLAACGDDVDPQQRRPESPKHVDVYRPAPEDLVGRWELVKDADYNVRSDLLARRMIDRAVEAGQIDGQNPERQKEVWREIREDRAKFRIRLDLAADGTCSLWYAALHAESGLWRLEDRTLVVYELDGQGMDERGRPSPSDDARLRVVGESAAALTLHLIGEPEGDHLARQAARGTK